MGKEGERGDQVGWEDELVKVAGMGVLMVVGMRGHVVVGVLRVWVGQLTLPTLQRVCRY